MSVPNSTRISRLARWPLSLATWLLICNAGSPAAWACPNCKDNLGFQAGNSQLGYALSIVLMLSVPLAIIGGWSFVLFFHYRSFQLRFGGQART